MGNKHSTVGRNLQPSLPFSLPFRQLQPEGEPLLENYYNKSGDLKGMELEAAAESLKKQSALENEVRDMKLKISKLEASMAKRDSKSNLSMDRGKQVADAVKMKDFKELKDRILNLEANFREFLRKREKETEDLRKRIADLEEKLRKMMTNTAAINQVRMQSNDSKSANSGPELGTRSIEVDDYALLQLVLILLIGVLIGLNL